MVAAHRPTDSPRVAPGGRHTMRRALLVLVLCAACSANDTAPQPGNLTLSLPSSGGNDGAVVLVISGGPVTLVTPLQGSQAATSADGEGTHVMIVGNLT